MADGFSQFVPKVAGLLDFLLNVVGLLLWFNWRASGIKLATPGMVSLAATLQRTEAVEPRRWFSFGCLIALLIVRALLYCQVGSKVGWIATLDLTAIALPFRSDMLGRMFLFSLLSFFVALGVVYGSLLLLSVINNAKRETEYFSRLVTLQLGWLGKWYWPIRLLLPPVAGAGLWLLIYRYFADMGIIPAPRNFDHALQVAGVLSLCVIVSWKYVLSLMLGLHILNTYVYLGASSFWKYVTMTGERISSILRWAPMRFGKVDLAPVLILVLVLAVSHLSSLWLTQLYKRLPL
jgi:hypothetical protein